MSIAELERRVVALEETVTHLTRKLEASASHDVNAWIDRIAGTFKDDATYRKATRLGRQWRESFRPVTSRSHKGSRK